MTSRKTTAANERSKGFHSKKTNTVSPLKPIPPAEPIRTLLQEISEQLRNSHIHLHIDPPDSPDRRKFLSAIALIGAGATACTTPAAYLAAKAAFQYADEARRQNLLHQEEMNQA